MDDDQEKTEQPTDKKLLDAREKGQVTKSREINSLRRFWNWSYNDLHNQRIPWQENL